MKDNEIREMTEKMAQAHIKHDGCSVCRINYATALHEAGYRKQSETVKEFAEKLTKRLTKEVKDNPEAAASQYKAGLYFAMDLVEQFGKEE